MKEITPSLLQRLDIIAQHVPIVDQQPPQIEQVAPMLGFLDAMKAQQRPTLVHCHAGIGRTGTVLHLYFLAKGQSLEETQAVIWAKRSYCTLLSEAQMKFISDYAASIKT